MKNLPLLVLLAALPMGCRVSGPRARPNVLLVTLDTLRADVLGCYGHPAQASPNLDRLAGEAALYERAWTVTPLTIPAHSSLFTGLYPPRHGVRDNGDFFLSDEARTLAEVLQAAGWATMASVGAEVTSHHWGFSQGFDAFYDEMGTPKGKGRENRWAVERPGDQVVDDALLWLSARSGQDPAAAPWFAWVHLFDAHTPYRPPEPEASRYPGRPYLGEVAWLDRQVGRLLDAVASRADYDHTWIILSADHGEGLGSHGEAMHGFLLYNETTRIPMWIRPPGGIPQGRRVTAPVSLVDLYPTVLAATGVAAPGPLDGLSLLPTLEPARPDTTGPLPQRDLYMETLYAFHHYGWAPQRGLVDGQNKLIDSTTPEVYAADDLGEHTDLASSKASLVLDLRNRLKSRVVEMEPQEQLAAQASTSPDRMAQLEALGYVSGASTDLDESTSGLPDPAQHLPLLARVEEARKAIQDGDPTRARAELEALLAVEPGLEEPRLLLSTLLFQQGEGPRALTMLQEMDARRPSSSTKSLLGSTYFLQGNFPEAILKLQEALALDPYLPRAWATYLHALYVAGDDGRLETELERARQMLPEAPEPMTMEGLLLVKRGNLEMADPLLKKAMALEPDQPFLNLALGMLARSKGNNDEAESRLEEEVQLFPWNLDARRMLVALYAEETRYNEQLEQLQVLVQVQPTDILTWHSLAQALYNVERYAEARGAVDTCRSLQPTYAPCAMLQANVLNRLGQRDQAWAAYREALDLAGQTEGKSPESPTVPGASPPPPGTTP